MKGRGALTVVIEGEARGADTMARNWALKAGVPFLAFPAQWKKYHLGAGPIRNRQMLEEGKPEIVVAFHDHIHQSKGTWNMIKQAQALKLPIILYTQDTITHL